PRTLVCHDLKGGYLDDEKCLLGWKMEGYRFWRWWQVDIFVYFSHNFVTIPPACWIDASHKHGVPILGTLITEWDDGVQLCSQFLKNDDVMEKFVKKLVDITLYYNFDGWLLNIENKLDFIERMLNFVEILTERLHKVHANSLVVWYDSVTIDGNLLWQNELNDNNVLFFNRCDGIFLNYTWTEENLNETMKRASLLNRPDNVFIGIDVFARGCVGKFDVCKSMEKIKSRNLSSAIFAPSWTFEAIGRDVELGKDFFQNETK
ncbi:hypothetical protein HELRODRAFT_84071, partial [Helobdella robusta]|uniref:Cytosolic endo-beta-N-acetylglucosaminidase TIM barrel domain-containing protein n=1 Tax=Helobdella robusta TaxID=6412 RepID=T1G5E3_HELRO